MIDWIESRMKHYSFWLKIKKRPWGLIRNNYFNPNDISLMTAEQMIKQRNDFYKNCLEVFGSESNFMILDIRNSNFFDKIENKINKKIKHEKRVYNKRNLSEIDIDDGRKILSVRKELYAKYGNIVNSCLTTEKNINESLLSFENNFTKKYCFLTTIESDNNSFNELVVMLKSFRENVKSMKESHFWVLVNDGGLHEEKVKYLENNFGPITVEQKRSLIDVSNFFKGPKTYRKYNSFLYFDKWREYDRMVNIDSDFIFTQDCYDILSKDRADFSAHISGHDVVPKDIFNYYEKYFDFKNEEIKKISLDWKDKIKTKEIKSRLMMPNFNSGFISLSLEGFLEIKRNIKKRLSQVYGYEENIPGIEVCAWKREQIALTLIAIKEIKNYEISHVQFYGPKMFHLMKGLYGDSHYGGNRKNFIKDSLPQLAELEIDKTKQAIKDKLQVMPSNRIYRIGDVLYRRYSWKNERLKILQSQEYKDTLLYSYLSNLDIPLNQPVDTFRKQDESYGMDCCETFLKAIKDNKDKYAKDLTLKEDALYINIRAGDIIDLHKPNLFINDKDKLYLKIRQKLSEDPSIKKIRIVTALHFGDAKNNRPQYRYKFSKQSEEKNLLQIKLIIDYISSNLCKDVQLIEVDKSKGELYNIDRDFYILSYGKHVILEDFGGFSKAVLDARRLIKGELIEESSRPKLNSNKTLQNAINNPKNSHGFFSLCSIHLFQIVQNIKDTLPENNIKFKEFMMHRGGRGKGIRNFIFEDVNNNLNIDVPLLRDDQYILRSNNIYYKNTDGNKYINLIKKWFKPKHEIQILTNLMIEELKLEQKSTLAVYYRGTDTTIDRRITYYNEFTKNIERIIKNYKNIKSIYLQTDDKMFQDYFLTSNIDKPILTNSYLQPKYSHKGQHFTTKEDCVLHVQKMLASVLLMSQCEYIICNTCNVSRWINFYRGDKGEFFQMKANSIYPPIND